MSCDLQDGGSQIFGPEILLLKTPKTFFKNIRSSIHSFGTQATNIWRKNIISNYSFETKATRF